MRWTTAAACLLLLGTWSFDASAQEVLEVYEDGRLDVAMTEAGVQLDHEPEGKRIAFIRVLRHDVFVPEEPWPVWPNMLHTRTNETVVRRECLFEVGQIFNQALLDETERNLRGMTIFSLVRIVPVKASKPGEVGIFVHTRDLWSLRIEWDLQVTGAVLDRLLVQGTERNVAGYGKAFVARFQMNPIVRKLGQVYEDRRLFMGTHRLEQSFDVFMNRDTGVTEGSQGVLSISRPFYSLGQSLSYRLDASYVRQISRVLQTGRVATYDIPGTDEVETIARAWDDDQVAVVGSASHRFGEAFKHSLTVGAGYRNRAVGANEQSRLPEGAEAAFARDVLPRVRREAFPSLSIEVFEARFETYRELGTFGQSENVRVGPYVKLSGTLPLEVWGSSTDSVTLSGELSYTLPFSGAMLDSTVAASGRYEEGELINQYLKLQLRGATPFMLGGRLAFRTVWEGRDEDRDNTPVSLGGDNGLRGYPSQAFIDFGASRLLSSVEYRTHPINWRSAHIGFVAFYDAGTVYTRLHEARMSYSVGTGLRILFPQFDRYVFRVDLGVPLSTPGFQVLAGFGSNQALPLTAAEDLQIAARQ